MKDDLNRVARFMRSVQAAEVQLKLSWTDKGDTFP